MRRDEKRSKTGMFMVIFISLIMITSVIGFLHDGGSGVVRYNDQKFKLRGQTWTTPLNGATFIFDHHPADISSVEMSIEAEQLLRGIPQVDVTSQANSSFAEDIALAQYNLGLNLERTQSFLRTGFLENNTYGLPIIDCSDASAAVPVIVFISGNSSTLSLKGTCLVATVRSAGDVHLIKDRILFAVLGI